MASYLLSYDVATASALEYQLLGFIKANRHITQWYRAYSGCYLLKSTSDLNTICQSFRDFFGFEHQHVLAPVVGANTGGILPEYIWKWLNEPETPSISQIFENYLLTHKDQNGPS